MLQNGISESVADGLTHMLKNINDGLSTVKRMPENTAPTTLEFFVQHGFKSTFE
jgi:hypothetical protein